MPVRMKAPAFVSSVSHNGEEYTVDADGFVVLPTTSVEHFKASHGFMDEAQAQAVADKEAKRAAKHGPLEADDAAVEDDLTDGDPSKMTVKDCKDYLKANGLSYPSPITAGGLREIVRQAMKDKADAAARSSGA